MNEQEARFYSIIRAGLAENPDWLRTALSAVTEGMSDALNAAHERAHKYDMAFRSALSLSDPKRLTADAKQMLCASIVEAINPKNTCQAERDALERIASFNAEAAQ